MSIKKIAIIAVIGIGILIIASLGYVGVKNTGFRVVKTVPSNNGVLNNGNSVVIEWDRDVQNPGTINASFTYTSKVAGKQVIITPNTALAHDKTYNLTVSGVKEKNGSSTSTPVSLTFTVAALPFNTLPPDQQKEITNSNNTEYRDNPVSAILPVRELEFAIDTTPINGKHYTVITPAVVAGPGLTEDEYNAEYKRELNEGKDYLKQKGFDPASINTISDQELAKLNATTQQGGE